MLVRFDLPLAEYAALQELQLSQEAQEALATAQPFVGGTRPGSTQLVRVICNARIAEELRERCQLEQLFGAATRITTAIHAAAREHHT